VVSISGGRWASPSTERNVLSTKTIVEDQKNDNRAWEHMRGRTFKPSRCRCMGSIKVEANPETFEASYQTNQEISRISPVFYVRRHEKEELTTPYQRVWS
jgi:hypothetical protein